MIKDLFLAILLGALLGFGATGGYYAYKNSQTKTTTPKTVIPTAAPTDASQVNAQNTSDDTTNPNPSTPPDKSKDSSTLQLSSPQDESIVTSPIITVKGTTTANSLVVVQTAKKSYQGQSDASGAFSITNVELDGGANLLQVSSFDPNDTQSDLDILVTYSTVKI